MWQQLSGFEKFQFVACVLGLPVTAVAVDDSGSRKVRNGR